MNKKLILVPLVTHFFILFSTGPMQDKQKENNKSFEEDSWRHTRECLGVSTVIGLGGGIIGTVTGAIAKYKYNLPSLKAASLKGLMYGAGIGAVMGAFIYLDEDYLKSEPKDNSVPTILQRSLAHGFHWATVGGVIGLAAGCRNAYRTHDSSMFMPLIKYCALIGGTLGALSGYWIDKSRSDSFKKLDEMLLNKSKIGDHTFDFKSRPGYLTFYNHSDSIRHTIPSRYRNKNNWSIAHLAWFRGNKKLVSDAITNNAYHERPILRDGEWQLLKLKNKKNDKK